MLAYNAISPVLLLANAMRYECVGGAAFMLIYYFIVFPADISMPMLLMFSIRAQALFVCHNTAVAP